MSDPTEKGSESEDMNGQNQSGLSSEESQMNEQNKKTCADCGTTKTPLWRGGPAGPKSLCNACGIRSRKKRRAFLGLNKGITEDNRKNKKSSSNGGGSSSTKVRARLKQKLLDLGRDVLMQRSTVEKQRKKLGEEEEAAVLLMALSYGSVYMLKDKQARI